MARPRKGIPWAQIQKLCGHFCTLEEIASITELSEDTIERACLRDKNLSFADFFKKHSAKGKSSLRRKQFQVAIAGDKTMLIWLGKNYLGQTDTQPEDEKDTPDQTVNINFVAAKK